MLANLAVLLLAAAAAASPGWTIPADQPDGVYSVSVDAAGNATHTFLAPISTDALAERSALLSPPGRHRRQVPGHTAWCLDYRLTKADADLAYKSLAGQCGQGRRVSGGNSGVYGRSGEVVVYFCNYAANGGANTCYSNELQDSIVNVLEKACGSYQASFDHRDDRFCSYGQESVRSNPTYCGWPH